MDSRVVSVGQKLEELRAELTPWRPIGSPPRDAPPDFSLEYGDEAALRKLGLPLVDKVLQALAAEQKRNWKYRDQLNAIHSQVVACMKLLESYYNSDPIVDRNKYIADWLARGRKPETATRIAERFGITRTTLYKIIRKLSRDTGKA